MESFDVIFFGHQCKKIVFEGLQDNKGTDQPAYQYSLIITSFIPILESIISGLATSEIMTF